MPSVKTEGRGTSLVVQWLELHTSTAGGPGLIPGQGTKIRQATPQWPKKKRPKKESQVSNRDINGLMDGELTGLKQGPGVTPHRVPGGQDSVAGSTPWGRGDSQL